MTYEARNQATLNGVHPALRYKLLHLSDLLRLIGEDVLFYEGNRSIAEQNADWQVGRDENGNVIGPTVTDAKGGYSFHNFGLAVDFAPVGPLGVALSKRNMLEWAAKGRYDAIGSLAETIGLEWGGRWKKKDGPHLQFTDGLSIASVRKGQRPSADKSLFDLLAYYQDRIKKARNGLKHADRERTAAIHRHIQNLEEAISAIL